MALENGLVVAFTVRADGPHRNPYFRKIQMSLGSGFVERAALGHRRWLPLVVCAVSAGGLLGCGGSGAPAETSAGASASAASTAAATGADSRKQTQASIPDTPIPADAHLKGMWGPVFNWPMIPIHSVLLPDGRLLTYGSRPDGNSTAYFNVDVWDNVGSPDAGHMTVANGTGNDLFCGSQLLLPPMDATSGARVFVAGGDAWDGKASTLTGIAGASVFNVGTNSMSNAGNLSQPRWYSTSITLTNGETYIQGGFGGTERPDVRQADGSFRRLTGADTSFLQWSYPRNYVMPDGRVFGYDYEGRMYFVNTEGAGSVSARNILPWQYFGTGSSAMFRPGHILQIGGNSNGCGVVDVTSGSPVFTPTQSTSSVRKLNNSTLLPDGQVVVTGGSPVWNELPGANRNAEIWNPVTGQWTLGAAEDRARLYHSTAILLPDGTVITGGGGAPTPIGGAPLGEQNMEIYYPPYLFTAAGARAARPAISAAPDWLEIGKAFSLDTTGNGVSRVTLVKTGSVTHGWNFDQRFIELPFVRTATANGSRLVVNSPSKPGEATPGYYMLFVIDDNGVPSVAKILKMGIAPATDTARAPVVAQSGPMSVALGSGIGRTFTATDPNGDRLTWSAAGLPAGTSINSATGELTGVPSAAGTYYVAVSANDGSFSDSTRFVLTVNAQTPLTVTLMPRPGASLANGEAVFAAGATGQGTVEYSWNFGDGTADTAWSSDGNISKRFVKAGTYSVTLRVRDASGNVISRSFLQTVYIGSGARRPVASTNITVEVAIHGRDRVWVVNADNDSVSGFDTVTYEAFGEVPVGSAPRSIAQAGTGKLWVTNSGSSTISIIDPYTKVVERTLSLPRGAQPYGVAISPTAPQAFVVLEGRGELLRFDTNTYAQTGLLAVGANVRHVSIDGTGKEVFVSRFITPPMPGESTGSVSFPANKGGEVLHIDPAAMTLKRTVILGNSTRADSENQGRGIPNYVGAVAISPDHTQAYVPSKQDNIGRGTLRDKQPLNFQNTVRAVSSRIALTGATAFSEDLVRRIDHDNASVASAATYDSRGALLFVALETSREVAVIDAHSGGQLLRFDVGRAPQGLALSADGWTLYVNNFMDRTITAHDLKPLLAEGSGQVNLLKTFQPITTERLAANVLKGKQFFYDARDGRLARDGYMSCASCHNDGSHDGRVWDMTHAGEGVRNTTNLRGRAGAQGRLHWSANFDEVQDFEAQIRSLAGGTGLMTDAQFNTGTRSQPLGDRKTGVNADLDALAAYVTSLSSASISPFRDASGALTASATAGKTVFADKCSSCHAGVDFSDSRNSVLRNVGTINAASGLRLGGALNGIDTPTVRDAWATAPYLHNGSAATIEAAIQSHSNLVLTATELANVAAYTRQLDRAEAAAPSSTANLVVRMMSSIADKFGSLFEVRVNGNTVGQGQIEARTWVDVFFDTVRIAQNAVIEVVFKNDAIINGQDRNLSVQSVRLNGTTTVSSTATGAVVDHGTGAAAFDNLNTVTAASTGGALNRNGALRITAPASDNTVIVRGATTLAGGVGATMELRINGVLIGTRQLTTPTVQNQVFTTPSIAAGDRIDVVFTNDAIVNGVDRNLYVESVTARGRVMSSTAAGAVLDQGAGTQAFDGVSVVPGSTYGGWVPWNGALRLVAQ